MNVIEYLKIPKASSLNQRVPIQTIVDAHNLEKSEEKLLRDHIGSIYLIAALNENTISVRPFKDEEMNYEEIHILSIQLKQETKLLALNSLIHKLFPNPTLAIYKINKFYLYSTALKHPHQTNQNQAVIDEVFTTDKSTFEDEASISFLKRTQLNEIKAKHLKQYYEKLTDIIYQQRLIKIIGVYPSKDLDASKIKSLLKDIENEQAKLNKLKEEASSHQTMRAKMKNHMEQNQIKNSIQSIITILKELM